MKRLTVKLLTALITTTSFCAALTLSVAPSDAIAQSKKNSVVLGMILEPTSLDPTTAPAAAIGEIVHYNILEGLTKINVDGSVTPLLAESWAMDPDGKLFTFKLRKGVKFQDGAAFDSSAVKFSFERAKDEKSTNKAKKAVFDNISRIETPDAHTVIMVLNSPDGNFLFRMGENTAVILHPSTAAAAATKPIGTGPYKLENWAKGSAVTLTKWDGFRNPSVIKISKVTFRFINDSAAQVAALLAGDIDGMPRFGALQSLKQFQGDKRFSVEIGDTAGKGIMTINNKKKPFDDVRVRRALMHAIDRKAFIDGVLEGLGRPIGSHMAPTDAGYVDLTNQYAYDPEKAKALLKEAGVTTPLNVTLTLPPPPYARKGRHHRKN
jgi:peptide/nickel transport system substrate-binding protein